MQKIYELTKDSKTFTFWYCKNLGNWQSWETEKKQGEKVGGGEAMEGKKIKMGTRDTHLQS